MTKPTQFGDEPLFFTHGCNIGFVAGKDIPKEPVIAIVANSNGKIFPLLMDKSDIGKVTLQIAKAPIKKELTLNTHPNKTSFENYEKERTNDIEDWEDQRLDAFEGDESNFCRKETFNKDFYLSLQLNVQCICVQVYVIKDSTLEKSV